MISSCMGNMLSSMTGGGQIDWLGYYENSPCFSNLSFSFTNAF